MIFFYVGFFFLIVGIAFFLFPPKGENLIYGYRSERAKFSADSWLYAQRVARQYFLIAGGLMTAIGSWLRLSGYTNFFLIELLVIPWFIAPMFGRIEQKLDRFNRSLRGDENEHIND